MRKTVSITLIALMVAVAGCAATSVQLGGLRGSGPGTADDKAFAEKQYQGKKPGAPGQEKIARTFKEQPPLIPHTLVNFGDISLEENQCMSCHGPDKYKEKNAPLMGDSHFLMAGGKKTVSMGRYQCDSCHVPQVDATPLVENQFVGNVPPR